ncbi:MAG: sulfatase [Halobacteriota archaeon]
MANKHVFLFSADGLRYDRLSSSGYDVPTTPHLDNLATSGAACQQAMVTGTGTRKSFPGILTSSYPLMYGGYAQLTDYRTTLASAFREEGYATLGVNANAQLHSRFGWDHGFDVYFDSDRMVVNREIGAFSGERDAGSEESAFRRRFEDLKSGVYERLDQNGVLYRFLEAGYRAIESRRPPHPTADEVVDRTLSFLDKAPNDRPLFVWVHFMDTHSPYLPPKKYREVVDAPDVPEGQLWQINDRLHTDPDSLSDDEVAIVSEMYDASLRHMDEEIGRLVDGLVERGLWTDTQVAFTSDHGEEFREHGGLTHCIEPYEEGAHVPLLFRLGETNLTTVDGVVSTIDIGPTLLKAAVADPEIPERFHGRSLLSVLRGDETIPEDRAVFVQNANREGREVDIDRRITGVRTADWKFITSLDERIETKLFHLPSDPGERQNIAAEEPEQVETFEGIIDDHYGQPAYADYEIEGAVDTGAVGERLEALGYIDH